MKRTWIKNARIVNEGKIFHGSIVIENEVIAEVLAEETVPAQPCGEIIDAKGYYLIPGVIDDHVHFRDPGLTHKADIHTESTAAAAAPDIMAPNRCNRSWRRAKRISRPRSNCFLSGNVTSEGGSTGIASHREVICAAMAG
jgi:predicted amidohydrolase YtcJ